MSATEKFADAVSSLFSSKERGLQRDLRNAEKKRAAIEGEKRIAQLHASHLDRLELVTGQYAAKCLELEQFRIPAKEIAQDMVNGASLSSLGAQLAAAAAIEMNIEEIKKELRSLIVAPSEKTLANFVRENASVIKKLPKPKKAPEQPFVAPEPIDEWESKPLSPLQVVAGAVCGCAAEEDDD